MRNLLKQLGFIMIGVLLGAGLTFRILKSNEKVGVDPWLYEQALRDRQISLLLAHRAIDIADSLNKETIKRGKKIDSLSRKITEIRNTPLPEKKYSVKELELLFEEWYYRDIEENEDY